MTEAERAVAPLGHPVDAEVRLPGSKSITNRALVCAALADGRSSLEGVLRADDTEAMVSCLEALGVAVQSSWAAEQLRVEGCGGRFPAGNAILDVWIGMSGTTARFVAPLLALGKGRRRLTGHPQLRARPMGPTVAALRSLGADVTSTGDGHLPIDVEASGGLRGGRVELPGHASSQFLSGLLLAGPAMDEGLAVTITSPLVSRPYVTLTMATMADFGLEVAVTADGRFTIEPGRYLSGEHRIEPDASGASYFFAAAAICGGRVRVPGLGTSSRQGDLAFADVLGRMGAEVERSPDWTEVRGTGPLEGIEVDLADLSDTAPTLAVVAACVSSPTVVTGVGFIRAKESDRIAAVVTELRRCGVDAEERPDGFVVHPDPEALHGARIETYDDHRMAMSFAVLGLRVPHLSIADPRCVAKTFPSFFEVLEGLR